MGEGRGGMGREGKGRVGINSRSLQVTGCGSREPRALDRASEGKRRHSATMRTSERIAEVIVARGHDDSDDESCHPCERRELW
jgi:hypothetical protein